MHTRAQSHRPILGVSWNPCHVALTILTTLLSLMFIFLFLTVTAQPAQGQTFRVLHDFAGQADGELPFGTPMVDTAGNVYGTAWAASRPCPGCPSRGPIYRLRLADSGWLFSIIANVEGVFVTGLSHDRQDVFYGTDANDGSFPGGVFKLNPQPGKPFPILGQWMATFLYEFRGGDDGNSPNDLTIDPQGDLYGTTTWGGVYGGGTVFKLTRAPGGWTYEVLYNFTGQTGSQPGGRVAVDAAGNVYGTAWSGGNNDCGVIFQVTPLGEETVLHYFTSDDGCGSASGLIFDSLGNLYGASAVLYELSPSDGGWNYRQVFRLPDGGPTNLVLDSAGNFYGAITFGGPSRSGEVFKLAPQGGGWNYTVLHDFSGPDGWGLYAGVALDSQGNLFGAGTQGGAYNLGVVFEIMP